MSVQVSEPDTERLVSDADHVQLARLVTELSWRIDHGRADTVHELFAEDGVMHLGESPLSGRKAIGDWGRNLVDEPTYPGIRHVATNMRFAAEGDDAAVGTTLLTAYLDQGDGWARTLPFMVGEDEDRFVRTDQGWRFASRRWHPLFDRRDQ
jgi:hypothetical protein